jgi:hypothetical protein
MAEWTSPIYVFFKTKPRIEYIDDRKAHVFQCASGRCKGRNGRDVRRYQDKGDRNSTSNLRKHAKICWGEDAVASADSTCDVEAAREVLIKSGLRDRSITGEFERIGKGKVTFSTRQHTKTETRFVPLHVYKSPLKPLTPT